ncbi:uncharacterized protein [Palaemon carinicauda]
MTEVDSGSSQAVVDFLAGTNLVSNNTITKIITTLATLLNIEDVSKWTREGSEFLSRLVSVGLEPFSQDVTSNWLSILYSTGFWGVAVFTAPVLLTGLLWYFVVTFLLRKNVMGFLLGRSLREEVENQTRLDRLTRSVSDAIGHLR